MALRFLSQSIPDQWQVEDRTQYSGSYTNAVMSGNVFDTVPVIGNGSLGGRYRIAEHGSGSNLIKFLSGAFTTNYNFALLEDLFFAHQKHRISGLNYGFFSPVCQTETYYDSLIPDPYSIYTSNSGVLVYSKPDDWRSIGSNDLFWEGMSINAKFLLSYVDMPITASDNSQNLSDNNWLQDYPFMRKYTNIKRLSSFPSIHFPYSASEYMTFSASSVIDVRYSSSNDAFFGPSIISNPPDINIELISLSQSGDTQFSSTKVHRTFVSILGIVGGPTATFLTMSQPFTPSTIGGYGLSRFVNSYPDQIGNPFAKVFFGIGNGFRGSVQYDATYNDHSGSANYYRAASPIIRGWKYGLYNAVPTQTRAYFDKNKFGQFRHMFEQRPFTRNCNIQSNQIGSLDGPIQISFVSGTVEAVSASNQTLYNPNDSGIWDTFYQSLRPWVDV